jgi:dTDP-4-dehydrorhamnose 3,5-epimerase
VSKIKVTELNLEGVLLFESTSHGDDRGYFREWYCKSKMEAFLPTDFNPHQVNLSLSKINVIRGIHFSLSEKGQAKLITCIQGSIQDIAVDLRPSSSTFGQWVEADLNGNSNSSLFIPVGFGHALLAREPNTIISYVLSSEYNPINEHTIDPLDPDIGIKWKGNSFILSERDTFAKKLNEFEFKI